MRHAWMLVPLALGGCGPSPGAETTDDATTSVATVTSEGSLELPPVTCPNQPATGSGAEAACPEHQHTDACCCFVDEWADDMTGVGTKSMCGITELCPRMDFVCTDGIPGNDGIGIAPDCPSERLTTSSEAAIDCSLAALASGAVGRISWYIGDESSGWSHEAVQLDLAGDGSMFRQGDAHVDLGVTIFQVERFPLPANIYFTECTNALDWRTRFDCIRTAYACEPLETCVVPHQNE